MLRETDTSKQRAGRCLWPALALAVAASLAAAGCSSKGSEPTAKGGPGGRRGGDGVPVTVSRVAQKDVPVDIQVVGNGEAYSTILVKAQVGGTLTEVHFKEGDFVKKGDLLFVIDRRPFEAALNQAEANVARDEALLAQSEATLSRDLAQQKFNQEQSGRYTKLFDQGIISKDLTEQIRTSADTIGAAVRADQAAVRSARAAIAAGKSAVESAQLNLSYTNIYSPVNGRTGNIDTKLGNLITANNLQLTTINQVEPMYVTFNVPEDRLPEIKRRMGTGRLPVIVTFPDDPAARETGALTFVDNTVDPTTGTIKLKGTFGNADRKLWPGQFVRVTLRLAVEQNALVVPNQAVQTGQDGNYVFVVKEDRTVESRPVTPGVRVEQDLVIDKGLAAGETVVTEGHLRLAPGMKVVVRDGRPDAPGGGRGPGAGGKGKAHT